jgi:hypothetical protein
MSTVGAVLERCGPGASPLQASQPETEHATHKAHAGDQAFEKVISDDDCDARAGFDALPLPHLPRWRR